MTQRPTDLFLIIVLLLSFIRLTHATDIADEYVVGDALTADKMNNIKTAVNSKQNKITGGCLDNQAVKTIGTDGSVTCQSVITEDATTLEGIRANGFVRSNQLCEGASKVVQGFTENGKVVCLAVENTRVQGSCDTNQVMVGITAEGTIQCEELKEEAPIDADKLGGLEASDFAKLNQNCVSDENEVQSISEIDQQGQISCEKTVYFLVSYRERIRQLESTVRTDFTLDSEFQITKDIGGNIDSDTGRFIAPSAGVYLLTGNLRIRSAIAVDRTPTLNIRLVAGPQSFVIGLSTQEELDNGTVRAHRSDFPFSALTWLETGDEAYISFNLAFEPDTPAILYGTDTENSIGFSYFSGTKLH